MVRHLRIKRMPTYPFKLGNRRFETKKKALNFLKEQRKRSTSYASFIKMTLEKNVKGRWKKVKTY